MSVSEQRVVLELPRGNLEVVYPKILLFQEIKRLIIKERAYMQAYRHIKRHKLDMNLIPDTDSQIFFEEVSSGAFIEKFRKIDDINLILNSLESELSPDLKYMYSSEEVAQQKRKASELWKKTGASKINYICDLLRRAMLKEQDFFILSIVMTYTRHQPPQLAQALELVRDLQKDEDELCDVVTAPHLNPSSRFFLK